jgi:DNA-binding CsgD family transcriptional regulator/tetratricopeptide (TPR) repeat protein
VVAYDLGMVRAVGLVGRPQEVAAIRNLVDALPIGGVMVIEGEAGIGKTSLIDVACARAAARGVVVQRAGADEFSTSRPFGLLPAAIGSASPGRSSALDVDAVLDAVDRLAGGRPFLLALEDLQWADSASLAALASIVRRLVPIGAAVILSMRTWPRPVELDQLVDRLLGSDPVHLHLGPLSADEMVALASLRLGSAPSPRLRSAINGAGGNPFYALQVLNTFDAEGRLSFGGAHVDVSDGELTDSLQRLLVRRVRLLGDDAVKLLRAAAVLGRSFQLTTLAELVQRSVTDTSDILGPALDARVLGADGARLMFRHDLVREALEADIPLGVRMNLHRAAVDVLVAANAPAVELASHLLRADLGAGDVDLLVAAAAGSTPDAALGLTNKALTLVSDSDPRYAPLCSDRIEALVWAGRPADAIESGRTLLAGDLGNELSFRIRTAIAHALFLLGRSGEAVDTWQWLPDWEDPVWRAGEHAEAAFAALFAGRLQHAEALARTAGTLADDPTSDTIASTVLAWVHSIGGDMTTALACADRAVQRNAEADESARRVGAFLVRSMVRDLLGDDEGAAADLERDRSAAPDLAATMRVPFRHALQALVLFTGGRWDDAAAELDAARSASEDLQVEAVGAWTASLAAVLALFRDGPARAGELLGGASSMGLGSDRLMWAQALVNEANGDAAGALSLLRLVATIGSAVGSRVSAALVAPDLVRLTVAHEPPAVADQQVGALLSSLTWVDSSAAPGMIMCRDWSAAFHAGDPDQLVTLAGTWSGRRPFDAARMWRDASQLYAARGNLGEAREAANAALLVYSRLGADAAESVLRSMMRDAGVRLRLGKPTRSRTGWEAVTATERQVVDLVTDGLTNAAIADRLFMSRRTVESHLAHLYTKLAIPSRVALVRAVLDQRGESNVEPNTLRVRTHAKRRRSYSEG